MQAFNKDIHICTSVFKVFLAKLPKPIFPQSVFRCLMQVRDGNDKVAAVRDLFLRLSEPNRDLLSFVLVFLNYVSRFQEYNRMNAKALGVCIAPTLVRLTQQDDQAVILPMVSEVVSILIENVDTLLPDNRASYFGQPFQQKWKEQQIERQVIKQEPQDPTPKLDLNLEIRNEQQIMEYVQKDRQLFHRSNRWEDMSFTQLVQEYQALKTAASIFLYNTFFETGEWPPDASWRNVMETIEQLKNQIKMHNRVVPDTFISFHVPTNVPNPTLPNTLDGLASFVAEVQTELIMIQQRLDELPDPITLLDKRNYHTLAERKLLVAKQGHLYTINEYIKVNINTILANIPN